MWITVHCSSWKACLVPLTRRISEERGSDRRWEPYAESCTKTRCYRVATLTAVHRLSPASLGLDHGAQRRRHRLLCLPEEQRFRLRKPHAGAARRPIRRVSAVAEAAQQRWALSPVSRRLIAIFADRRRQSKEQYPYRGLYRNMKAPLNGQ